MIHCGALGFWRFGLWGWGIDCDECFAILCSQYDTLINRYLCRGPELPTTKQHPCFRAAAEALFSL